MIKTVEFTYNTHNGNQYPLKLIYKWISSEGLVYQPEYIIELCRIGCKNFGMAGGCPPRAPLLSSIISAPQPVLLLGCVFESVYKPSNILKSNNVAIHWKFQDAILSRLLNKIGHNLVAGVGGRFLATGYCLGCPGKKCAFKLGKEACRNPLRRTFSMEATGINVVATVKQSLELDMYWYTKENRNIPYMLKCLTFIPPGKSELQLEQTLFILEEFLENHLNKS